MKTEHQQRIDEFMRLAAQVMPPRPMMPPKDVREFRARLILEEAMETIKGLGFDIVQEEDGFDVQEACEPNIVEVVDGCADVSVVTIGTLSAFGVSDKPILEAVDANNLAKFGPGSYRRDDGKWMKPPCHKPADIAGLLMAQGYQPPHG